MSDLNELGKEKEPILVTDSLDTYRRAKSK